MDRVCSRRAFLAGGAAYGAAVCAEGPSVSAAAPLSFLAVADVHFNPGVLPHDDADWLHRILAPALERPTACVVQLGDFQHNARANRAFIDVFNDFAVPTHHVLGNHDDDGGPHAETLAAYRLTRGWYRFDAGAFRFLVLDSNYALLDGRFVHYGEPGTRAPWNLPREAQMRLTPEQLAWLKDELAAADRPCVVCAHRNLRTGSPDGAAFGAILRAANAAHPGRVRLVLNGHHHCDALHVQDGVIWYTVNSPNHCWVPKNHGGYPPEDAARWRGINHVVAYDTPLAAHITLHPDGRFVVRGMDGRFWRDIPPAKLGCSPGITASIRARDVNPLATCRAEDMSP